MHFIHWPLANRILGSLLFTLIISVPASTEATTCDLKQVAQAMKPVTRATIDGDPRLREAGLNANKAGPYINHSSGKITFTMRPDANLGTVCIQPSVERLVKQTNSVGEPRRLFAPDFSLEGTPVEQLPDILRFPYDAQLTVPAFHGGGTVHSTGKSVLVPIDILTADFQDASSSTLKKALVSDPFRMQLSVEAPDLPGSGNGPDHKNFVDFDSFLVWLKAYFGELRKAGKPIVPVTRSASTGYLIEAYRRHPGLFDGLVVMSPMHPVVGFEAGVEELYKAYEGKEDELNHNSIEFVQTMYRDMDWSNLDVELGDLKLLVLVGGQDPQVPSEVRVWYEDFVAKNPNRRMIYVENAGHDLYSFQNPELSLDIYFATQGFFFETRFPDLYAKLRETRDRLVQMMDELYAEGIRRENELNAEKARAKEIGLDIQEKTPILTLIEEESYLRYQLHYLETELGQSIPDEVKNALIGYRHLQTPERDGVQKMIQPYVEDHRSAFPAKKSFRRALEDAMINAQVDVLEDNNVTISADVQAMLDSRGNLDGNQRKKLIGKMDSLTKEYASELPGWHELEAQLQEAGEVVIGFASDPEFIELGRSIAALEASRDVLNKHIAENLQDPVRVYKKAVENFKKAVRALRHEVALFAMGEGPEPDFERVLNWDMDVAMQEVVAEEVRRKAEQDQRRRENEERQRQMREQAQADQASDG